jgi:hypothetical protein
MVQKTTFKIECSCGHIGNLSMRENDAPFSTQWEKYELTGFNGGSSCGKDPGYMSLKEVFFELAPTCPNCDQPIFEGNIKKG